jgi:DNA-binding phage protein
VGGKPRDEADIDDGVTQVAALMAQGVKRSDACAQVAKETGLAKRELYSASISAHP